MKAPRSNSTVRMGVPATISASAAGAVSSRANSSARLSVATAAAGSGPRTWRDSSGSSAVPTAAPMVPSGSWFTRSA